MAISDGSAGLFFVHIILFTFHQRVSVSSTCVCSASRFVCSSLNNLEDQEISFLHCWLLNNLVTLFYLSETAFSVPLSDSSSLKAQSVSMSQSASITNRITKIIKKMLVYSKRMRLTLTISIVSMMTLLRCSNVDQTPRKEKKTLIRFR